MKKLITLMLAFAMTGISFAQRRPPLPPRPPHPAAVAPRRPATPPTPPRPKSPAQVARDIDNALTGRRITKPSSHKYVKYNNGKHKGTVKRRVVAKHR